MRIRLFIFLFIILITSCTPIKNLSGEKFIAKSKMRTLELVFENDSICKFINTFNCKDLDPEVKKIEIICKYERKGDLIILRACLNFSSI